jgi:hypothetical protein
VTYALDITYSICTYGTIIQCDAMFLYIASLCHCPHTYKASCCSHTSHHSVTVLIHTKHHVGLIHRITLSSYLQSIMLSSYIASLCPHTYKASFCSHTSHHSVLIHTKPHAALIHCITVLRSITQLLYIASRNLIQPASYNAVLIHSITLPHL